jgi:uncharacterized protein (DUF1499 family)
MGLIRWFTRNWANTKDPTHADLTPLVVPLDQEGALELVRKAVATLPHWRVEESPTPGELRLTRRTRVFRFVDDVLVTFKPAGPGTMIHAASKSRVGIGDLGQNRRNILELFQAIRARNAERGAKRTKPSELSLFLPF